MLEGLHQEGTQSFHLPGHSVIQLIRFKNGMMAVGLLFLDTLFIDLITGKVHLTWRGQVGLERAIRVVETRMITRQGERHGQG